MGSIKGYEMSELKHCSCGADINIYLRIELLQKFGGVSIGSVSCSYCGYEAAAFSGKYIREDEFIEAAYEAWNARNTIKDEYPLHITNCAVCGSEFATAEQVNMNLLEKKHKDELAKVVQEAEERTRQKCAEAYWNNPQMGMAEKGRAILNAGKDE